MILGQRMKELRLELGLSQIAMSAPGFISAPAWIKVENGQRMPSEKVIGAFCDWLVGQKSWTRKRADRLRHELLTLKYLAATSPFVRALAQTPARDNGLAHLLAPKLPRVINRGRPRGS